jgi:deoxyribodipyrimidine photo-lyase
VFVWSPGDEGAFPPGAASRWWLHHSLAALGAALRARGSRLVIRAGSAARALVELARETGAERVCWSRRYEPAAVATERRVERALARAGVAARACSGALLFDPERIATRGGRPFQVFTPFWAACQAAPEPAAPLAAPRALRAPARWPRSERLESLALLPRVDWAAGLRATWHPGEAGAAARLAAFVRRGLGRYAGARDFPAGEAFSRLSPHLHFGEVSPRRVWHRVRAAAAARGDANGAQAFLRELGWREFAHHLLFHFPHTARTPLRPEFARFPWARAPAHLRAWREGRTGVPLVDAGMRQLWRTGWLPNRARMVVASYLVKDLLVPWQAGARWFWDTLVDADLANNTLGWQWSAGSGADAAPYFRIFNPAAQGERFDPDGAYVRAFVPELARLPARFIHDPARAPADVLARAGVAIGETYPAPIVDHAWARRRALEAFAEMRRG